MILKVIGAILIVVSCGSVGFKMAFNYREEEKNLREFIRILDYMECELQYRSTTFPELCRQVECTFKERLGEVFGVLALELEGNTSPSVEICLQAALKKCSDIPPLTLRNLTTFGGSVCRFDLDGQIKGLDAVRVECSKDLEVMEQNRDSRLRSYQTLGLCAGAALAILFV